MAVKKMLGSVDMKKLFPNLTWPSVSQSSQTPGSRPSAAKVFINHDLTKLRSEIAFRARTLKRQRSVTDTWVSDGVVFVKKNDKVHRITTMRQLRVFEQD